MVYAEILFKLKRPLIADRRVLSFEIVVADVASNVLKCFVVVFLFGRFQFGLDGSETRFHECVVVAITRAAHALSDVSPFDHLPIFLFACCPPRSE